MAAQMVGVGFCVAPGEAWYLPTNGLLGLKKVIAVDVSDRRLEMAKRLGADDTINASTDDPFEKALEIDSTPSE